MMIKVAHIITGLANGGAETMLLKLLVGGKGGGFDPLVISLTDEDVMGDRFRAAGIPVVTCDIPPGRFSVRGFLRLLHHLRHFRPEIVQTWLYHADLLGGIAAKLLGIRSVVWNIRHSNLDGDKNKAYTLCVVRINALLSGWLPKRIICNSANAAAIHQSRGFFSESFLIIPNGFDLDTLKPCDDAKDGICMEFNIPVDASLVGLIARFDLQKNHEGFVEAVSRVSAVNTNAYFLMAGTGVDWSNQTLVSWVDAHGLRDRVRLLGRRDDIPRLTAALDVAVCSSWGEGFPNAVGEAMACEVPCVVTNVGDCAKIVGDTGWVVEPGDMVALGDRIATALSMSTAERSRKGKRARERIVEHYSLSAVLAQYESLYYSMLMELR